MVIHPLMIFVVGDMADVLQHWKTSPWTDEPETRCLQKAVIFLILEERYVITLENCSILSYLRIFENVWDIWYLRFVMGPANWFDESSRLMLMHPIQRASVNWSSLSEVVPCVWCGWFPSLLWWVKYVSPGFLPCKIDCWLLKGSSWNYQSVFLILR